MAVSPRKFWRFPQRRIGSTSTPAPSTTVGYGESVEALVDLPKVIQPHRFAFNGAPPQGSLYKLLTRAQNHVLRYRRKELFSFGRVYIGQTAPIWPAGTSGETVYWRSRFHTGFAAKRVIFQTQIALDRTAASVNPRTRWSVTPSGGSVAYTNYASLGEYNGSPLDVPSEIATANSSFTCSPTTTYEVALLAYDNARPVSCCVFEESLDPETGTDFYTPIGHSLDAPIYDAHREEMIPAGTSMWQRNAAPLWTWAVTAANVLTRTSATYVNVIDQSSTTNLHSSPGVKIDLTYLTTYSRTVVPTVFSVYASSAGTGKAKIMDSAGSTVAEITGITTAGWYQTTASVTAGSNKFDFMFGGDGAASCSLYSMSWYQYE
jgi:hypothetical protein